MKKEELEKYIGELSPEMQEKARQCKDMNELNALLAENDVELSEDALGAVAGGCSALYPTVKIAVCPVHHDVQLTTRDSSSYYCRVCCKWYDKSEIYWKEQ